MKTLIHFLFVSTVLSLGLTENAFSQEDSSKASQQSPQSVGREFTYTGTVAWQNISFDKSDELESILFQLEEHQGVQFRIDLSDADSFGVTTERRTRIFIGSKVEIDCREGKRERLDPYKVTSFEWIAKRIVQEGRSHYIGTVEKLHMMFYEDRGLQLFLKLAEQPDLEFWIEAKAFENSVANWLGVIDEEGRVKISTGCRVSLTCDKDKTTSICRVTSLGCLDTPSPKLLPSFNIELQGNNEIRIRNPNEFKVFVGIRKGIEGKDFEVLPNGVSSVFIPDGKYDIYFIYSIKPNAVFKGDSFTLKGNGAEIQIVKVLNGNYQIKQIK